MKTNNKVEHTNNKVDQKIYIPSEITLDKLSPVDNDIKNKIRELKQEQEKKELLVNFKLSQRKIWLAVLLTFIFTPLGYIYARGWKGLLNFLILFISVMALSEMIITIFDTNEKTSEKIGNTIGYIGCIFAMSDNALAISKARKGIDKIS